MLKGTDIFGSHSVHRIINKQNVVTEKWWRLRHPKILTPWVFFFYAFLGIPKLSLVTELFTIAGQTQDLSWNPCWILWRLNRALRRGQQEVPEEEDAFQTRSSTDVLCGEPARIHQLLPHSCLTSSYGSRLRRKLYPARSLKETSMFPQCRLDIIATPGTHSATRSPGRFANPGSSPPLGPKSRRDSL